MAALNRGALVTAILGRRFPSSQTGNARRWLDTAYADVWAAGKTLEEGWPFEYVSRASLTIAAGNGTPTMPAAFSDVRGLWDAQGNELEQLNPQDFEDLFAQTLAVATTGTPTSFAVINRQITLAPVPSGGATFKLSYRRRLAHREVDLTTVTAGPMDEDDDYPLWDDHHALLIPRAQAIGLLELNDPTWQQQQAEYERQLDRMIDDYRPVPVAEQWGRVCWDA